MRVEALSVRAGIDGVVQEVMVEEGQRVLLGANIARVARPDDLRAELRVPETQARDVQLDELVRVDTRNGIVEGRVVRIDPAVQSGTVQVDVDLTGALPRGARPDLSVDGTIEIERLPNVVYTGPGLRPAELDGEAVQARRGRPLRGASARRARPHVGERRRDPERALAGRSSDPVRHVRVGRPRADPPELISPARGGRCSRAF